MKYPMNTSLYNLLLDQLAAKLNLLPDKPEETPKTTLIALWCTAAGNPLSAERAAEILLDDLDSRQEKILRQLVAKRVSGVPLAHLTGRQCFMNVELLVGTEALIPRKETEILGRAAVDLLNQMRMEGKDSLRILDVCTGVGNLAVAMALHCPTCRIYASDLSEDAVSLARKNVAFHGLTDRVEICTGDLFAPFDPDQFYQSIDLLLCNPPYISTNRVNNMDREIAAHEPALAFDGGVFGIRILHRLIKEALPYLKPGGWLAFEVGAGQGEKLVRRLETKYGYSPVTTVTDEAGTVRAILARNGREK